MSKTEKYLIAAFCLVAGISIIESAYLGINGHHTFRQADVYGNILGILNLKGFELFDLFAPRNPWGDRAVFDLPIYQYLVAGVSRLLGKDPLVAVRYVNLFLWMVTAFFSYRICLKIGQRDSGLIFIALFATSPLFLHYFSVPLPDNLAIALSVIASALLLDNKLYNWRNFGCAFACIVIAAAVKSPIPFVFLIFSATYFTLSFFEDRSRIQKKLKEGWLFLAFLTACLIAVVFIEIYRGLLMAGVGSESGHSLTWYFGTIDLRLRLVFWKKMVLRFNDWIPPYFGAIFALVSTLSIVVNRDVNNIRVIVSGVTAFLTGWLVFSNLYRIHDYYQLPVAVIIFISFAVTTSYLIAALKRKIRFSHRATSTFLVTLAGFFLIHMSNQPSYSVKERADFWKAVEYSLQEDRLFLFVSNERGNPAPGGYVSTKFMVVDPSEFELNCSGYLEQYNAILLEGSDSQCIESSKQAATHYLRDENNVFFRIEQPALEQ